MQFSGLAKTVRASGLRVTSLASKASAPCGLRTASCKLTLANSSSCLPHQTPATILASSLLGQGPASAAYPAKGSKRLTTMAALPAAVAVIPEPVTGGFWQEGEDMEELRLLGEAATAPQMVNPAATCPPSDDPNHGFTWLNHPCPHNPFRHQCDEDAWYVPPNLEQRQLAQAMGLPLHGIL